RPSSCSRKFDAVSSPSRTIVTVWFPLLRAISSLMTSWSSASTDPTSDADTSGGIPTFKDTSLILRPSPRSVGPPGLSTAAACQTSAHQNDTGELSERGWVGGQLYPNCLRSGPVFCKTLVDERDDLVERRRQPTLLLCDAPDQAVHALDVLGAAKQSARRR